MPEDIQNCTAYEVGRAVFRIWNPKLSGAYIYIMINQWIRKLQTVNCLSLVIANNASKKMSIVVVYISHRLTYLEYYLYVVVAKIRFKVQTNKKQLWYQHKSKQVTETCLQNTKTKSNDSYFFSLMESCRHQSLQICFTEACNRFLMATITQNKVHEINREELHSYILCCVRLSAHDHSKFLPGVILNNL